MTVIAWDGKTLAADKRAISMGLVFNVTKIFRSGDRLVGFSGEAGRIGEFRAWFEAGRDPVTYPKNKGDNCCWPLAIRPDGTIEQYETTGYPIIVEEPYFATGNGRDFAIAVMDLGFNAKLAVEVASRHSSDCGNGVDTLTFGETPQWTQSDHTARPEVQASDRGGD